LKERTGKYKRKTAETAVSVKINLDGSGICNVQTEIFFLNHMLSLLAKHGFFDIKQVVILRSIIIILWRI